MALLLKDRVKETTTTSGTGDVTLAGAVEGFQTFGAVLSNADTTYYAISHRDYDEWEVGLGTYDSTAGTIARTTVLESSNSGSAVSFTAGTKDIFITLPAEKAVALDASDDLSVGNIITSGYLRGPATFTIDPAAHGDNTGTLVVAGDLQVDGTTTTVNSTNLSVDDLNITVASGATNAAAANGAGLTVDGANATFTYDSANDRWAMNKGLEITGTLTSDGLTVDATSITGQTLHNSAGASIYTRYQNNSGNDNYVGYTGNNFEVFPNNTKALSVASGGNISFYEDTGTTAKLTWDASAESLNFADNGKAIFGAGSDLQIYHDGSNSYVSDQGSGSLYLQGTSLFITDADGNEFIRCSDQGSGGIVYLKNLGATKLTTTSTGVNITGSLNVTDAATTRTNLDVDQAGTALALAIALG